MKSEIEEEGREFVETLQGKTLLNYMLARTHDWLISLIANTDLCCTGYNLNQD